MNTSYFTLTHPEILFCSRFKNQTSQLHLTWKDSRASTGGSVELLMLAVEEQVRKSLENWGQEERKQNDKVLSLDTDCSLWHWEIISDIRSSDYSTSHSGGRLALRFKSFSVRLAMASYQNQRIQLWTGNWNSTANAPALTATTS